MFYFIGYYSKAYCSFYREKFGLCRKQQKIVDKHESCESFKTKTFDRTVKRAAVIDALNNALTEINTIKTILEECELKK